MSKVKVLYVRNLTQDVSEEKLKEQFEQFGKVERVKKIKDYAFVHFEDRDSAVIAMRGLNGKEIGSSNIEVSLAKPPSDKKKKEEILRARERRMMQMMQGRPGVVGNLSPTHPGIMSLAAPMRISSGSRIPLRTPLARDYAYDVGDLKTHYEFRGNFVPPAPTEVFYDEYFGAFNGGLEYFDYQNNSHQMVPLSSQSTSQQTNPAVLSSINANISRNNVGGPGRGITIRLGQVVGVHGNISCQEAPLIPVEVAVAIQATVLGSPVTTGGVHGVLLMRLHNALGTQRANPQLNLTVAGKRKYEGGYQNPADIKRRFQSGLLGTSGGWGSLPLPQQPLGTNGENWYTDTFSTWS